MRALTLALAVLFATRLAGADAPPERPRKDVPYGIVLDNAAEVMTAHAIVLYPWHERAGAPWTLAELTPGRELAIDPEAPEPQLFRVKRSDLPSLEGEVGRAKSLAAGRMAIKMKGTECDSALPNHQQVLATSPVIRMRLHYTVDTHLLCELRRVAQESIEADSGATPAAGSAAAPASAAPAASTVAAPSPSSAGTPGSKGCGACALGGVDSPDARLLPLVGLSLWLLRRRRRLRFTA